MAEVVFLQDRFVPPEEAKLHVIEDGYLLGLGVFATLRGDDAACFRPDLHLDTFFAGADAFGLKAPFDRAQLVALADDAARRTEARQAYVRLTLTASNEGPRFSIIARPLAGPSDDVYARGVDAVTVRVRRQAFLPDASIKTTSYAAQVLARREAEARGAFEGIQLADDGALACGAMSNVFVVSSGALSTPSLDSGCRNGVTRRAVIELAREAGFHVREERVELSRLAEASEVFLTSTRLECLPIVRIDDKPVGAKFPVAEQLRRMLRACMTRESEARRGR